MKSGDQSRTMKAGEQFVFTPYAEWLLHKQVWMGSAYAQGSGVTGQARLHALPDRKFIVRRTTNPTKFLKEDFR